MGGRRRHGGKGIEDTYREAEVACGKGEYVKCMNLLAEVLEEAGRKDLANIVRASVAQLEKSGSTDNTHCYARLVLNIARKAIGIEKEEETPILNILK